MHAMVYRAIALLSVVVMLCGCHKTFKSIEEAPGASFGVIIAKPGESADNLKIYSETAIQLFELDKISALVIVADDSEKDVIYSYLSGMELEKIVALNFSYERPSKAMYDIRDVLGFHSSYLIIKRKIIVCW